MSYLRLLLLPPGCEITYSSIEGDWTEYGECVNGVAYRTRVVEYVEYNSCTEETTLVRTETETELKDCEPEPPCPEFATNGCDPPPPPPCQISDAGPFPQQGPPIAECGFFGTTPVQLEELPGFYICKASTDMYISSSPFPGPNCPNGHAISHITECVCPVS